MRSCQDEKSLRAALCKAFHSILHPQFSGIGVSQFVGFSPKFSTFITALVISHSNEPGQGRRTAELVCLQNRQSSVLVGIIDLFRPLGEINGLFSKSRANKYFTMAPKRFIFISIAREIDKGHRLATQTPIITIRNHIHILLHFLYSYLIAFCGFPGHQYVWPVKNQSQITAEIDKFEKKTSAQIMAIISSSWPTGKHHTQSRPYLP